MPQRSRLKKEATGVDAQAARQGQSPVVNAEVQLVNEDTKLRWCAPGLEIFLRLEISLDNDPSAAHSTDSTSNTGRILA
jgi:hypothetical protein